MKIRQKCLQDESFPDLEVVKEFMQQPEPISLNYVWKRPDMIKFVALAAKKLAWEDEYALSKIGPLLCRWHLTYPNEPSDMRVVSIKGIPVGKESYCYNVIWNTGESSLEPKDLVQRAYKDLVEEFWESKKVKRATIKKYRGGNEAQKKRLVDETVSTTKSRRRFLTDRKSTTNLKIQNIKKEAEDIFNLSDIVQEIVSRPMSNPAFNYLLK